MGQDGEATMLIANQLQNLNIESHEREDVVVDAVDVVVVFGEYGKEYLEVGNTGRNCWPLLKLRYQ